VWSVTKAYKLAAWHPWLLLSDRHTAGSESQDLKSCGYILTDCCCKAQTTKIGVILRVPQHGKRATDMHTRWVDQSASMTVTLTCLPSWHADQNITQGITCKLKLQNHLDRSRSVEGAERSRHNGAWPRIWPEAAGNQRRSKVLAEPVSAALQQLLAQPLPLHELKLWLKYLSLH
jgi:hypothetical protein